MKDIIISNNCISGYIYKNIGSKTNNIFNWTIINNDDMFYLIEHYNEINFSSYKLTSINSEESTGKLGIFCKKVHREIYGIEVDNKITIWLPYFYKNRSSNIDICQMFISGKNIEEFILEMYQSQMYLLNSDPIFVIDVIDKDEIDFFLKAEIKYDIIFFGYDTNLKDKYEDSDNIRFLFCDKEKRDDRIEFLIKNVKEFNTEKNNNKPKDINEVIKYFKENPPKNMFEFSKFAKFINDKDDKPKNKKVEIINPIISLTSYKERLKFCKGVIDSIFENSYEPYKIVLTLYKGDIEYIPDDLKEYIDNGKIELITVDEDLKAHKKYFYIMQKYRENPIITIDDDSYYTDDLIVSLVNSYRKYPKCVHARRVAKKTYDENNVINRYKDWEFEYTEITKPSNEILCEGVGGILYPSNILNISDDNLEDIRKYIYADDIYLNYLEMKNGIKCVYVPNVINTPQKIEEAEESALWKTICDPLKEDNPVDIAIKELLN